MTAIGATGTAPNEGGYRAVTRSTAGDPQTSQTDLEQEESQRQAARRKARLYGTPPKNDGSTNVIPFGPTGSTGVQAGGDGTGPTENTELTGYTGRTGTQPRPSAPKFDHRMALEFYDAVQQSAFVLRFKLGRSITSAEEFKALAKEADEKHEHLFFHVATLKPDWTDPTKHAKGRITTATKEHVLECPYLWGDCDAAKYEGDDPVEAAKHYKNEGLRVLTAIVNGLRALGITPFALWRSGAGWQFLIKLDRAIAPDEAEALVGKLHMALGFDPAVRNSNRILRVPGSVNWKSGKDGRVPSPCVPLSITQAVTKIDDVRAALANVAEPEQETKATGAPEIKIDWSKVKQPGWLQSGADLPADAPAKLKHIIGHTGNLKELNRDLIQLGILKKGYGSWSDVTHAIAAGFKFYGKYTPEEIAEALLADLPCNQHIAKQQDKERAIERAISRSHEPKPKSNISGHWPDGVDDKTERPRKGILNTIEAIKRAGITCTWDEFRQKEYWSGHADKSFDGEISDAAVTVTRRNIRQKYRLYPDITETRDAITDACHDNKSNPVLDYFARLKWDGKPRLDKMFHTYWGAYDTPLNAAIGRKVMCAIVRRAKRPGCKFDHQLVLQSPQGRKKSMFCEDLAVFPDLFTDAGDLSGTIKEQMEIIQGMQIIEFPELAGYGRATRERNKASLSRKNDRARLSYAHYATNQPRQSIPIATTNEGHYLNDPTGERRYWHVAVIFYDRDAFLADKDQLYAEAVAREPAEKLWLDTPELEAAHDAIVATVKAPNELVDMLADLQGEAWHVNGKDEERVSTADIRRALGLTEADAVRSHNIGQRIADAMKTLGWTKAPGTIRCHCHKNDAPGQFCSKKDQPTTGYTRPIPAGSGPTGATGPQGAQDSTGPGPTGPTGPAGAQGCARPLSVDPQNTPPLQPAAEAATDVGMPDEADAEMDEHIKRIRAQALELGAGNKALTQGLEKGLAHSQAAFALLKGNG